MVSNSVNDAAIDTALVEEYSVSFGPAIYNFSSSIETGADNELCIESINTGKPCFLVADGVIGVRIAGFLSQASNIEYNTASLCRMGSNSNEYRWFNDKTFHKADTNNTT